MWYYWLIPFAWAIDNHLRGGGGLFGLDTDKLLPGSPDPWCAIPVILFGWLVGITPVTYLVPYIGMIPTWILPYVSAIVFGLTWLCWSTPAWGFLQGLGNGPGPVTRQPSWYEALFLKTGNPYVAYGLRTTLFLIPMALIFGWYWILIGPLQVVAYALSWKISPSKQSGIPYGELITGAIFGAFAAGYATF